MSAEGMRADVALKNLFPPKQRGKKRKHTEEEKQAIQRMQEEARLKKQKRKELNRRQNEEKRLAKIKRTELNKKRIAEIEEKRLEKLKKKEMNKKLQAENLARSRRRKLSKQMNHEKMMHTNLGSKQAHQECVAHVPVDFRSVEAQIRKKLGMKTNVRLSYDMLRGGFVLKFANAKAASKVCGNATKLRPKTYKISMPAKVLPGPTESKCVFFLSPCQANHPDHAIAKKLVQSQIQQRDSLSELELWIESAHQHFCKYGTIVDVVRQRGFLVVQFQEEESAQKMMAALTGGETFNGAKILLAQEGTPTKKSKLDATTQYPMKKKDKALKAISAEE